VSFIAANRLQEPYLVRHKPKAPFTKATNSLEKQIILKAMAMIFACIAELKGQQ
jgi:hypothetical protein